MKRLINFCQTHVFGLSQLAILLVALFLRTYQFTQTPVALYADEASLLYDAYSLSLTGRDLHGDFLPLVTLTSYGDNKPSGYYYALIPFVKFFGPQDFVVKLPSLFAGIFLVWAVGKIFRLLKFFSSPAKNRLGALVVMSIAALNPSCIHLSRVGFETNLSTAFLLLGIILLLASLSNQRKINFQLLGGELALLLSFYTYHSARLVAPLVGLYFFILYIWQQRRHLRSQLLNLFCALALTFFCLLPFFFQQQTNNLVTRFTDTTIFSDLNVIVASNTCREQSQNQLLGKLFCHRYLYFGRFLIQNIFNSLNPYRLFFTGDGQLRHSPSLFGFFYPFELIFLLTALVFIIKTWRQNWQTFLFLFFWLFVTIIPTSLTYDNPHLLRSFSSLPVFFILFTLGLISLYHFCRRRWQKVTLTLFLFITYLFFASQFFCYYHSVYRHSSASVWQDGYRQAVAQMATLQEKYPYLPVYFSHDYGRLSMYYFLYHPVSPTVVQAATTETMAQGEFLSFSPDKVSFYALNPATEQLVVLSPAELERFSPDQLQEVQYIYNANDELAFVLAKVN